MKIIDTIMVFDAKSIIQDYPNPSQDSNNPTFINAKYIYMVTKADDALNGNAGGELNIKAKTGDILRWRETTVSMDKDYSAICYAFVPTAGGGLITTPEAQEIKVTIDIPNPDAAPTGGWPIAVKTEKVDDFYWQCTAKDEGQLTYHFRFMILDDDENLVGYFHWDPFVTINS